jgi:hypothetical protein
MGKENPSFHKSLVLCRKWKPDRQQSCVDVASAGNQHRRRFHRARRPIPLLFWLAVLSGCENQVAILTQSTLRFRSRCVPSRVGRTGIGSASVSTVIEPGTIRIGGATYAPLGMTIGGGVSRPGGGGFIWGLAKTGVPAKSKVANVRAIAALVTSKELPTG